MMPISEKYADMGCVVVGKVESGHIKKGQNLLLMPNKTPVTVTGVLNEVEEEIPVALCGDNVRLRLRGVEDTEINVGFVLTSPKAPVHTITQFEAQLVILDHKNIITAGYGAVMHVHTAAEEVSLSALLHYFDKKTGKKSRRPPQFAKKGKRSRLFFFFFFRLLEFKSDLVRLMRTGQKIIALIEAAGPLCVEKFADHPQLGRFTLRDEGKTVAIGKITKLIEVRHRLVSHVLVGPESDQDDICDRERTTSPTLRSSTSLLKNSCSRRFRSRVQRCPSFLFDISTVIYVEMPERRIEFHREGEASFECARLPL